ncbi:MAG: hypothetical protein C4523_09455 [Myxococcales bacterium]|nr:MAG: hypothetical protein C4523_09455 [Myxococcales bacterium]
MTHLARSNRYPSAPAAATGHLSSKTTLETVAEALDRFRLDDAEATVSIGSDPQTVLAALNPLGVKNLTLKLRGTRDHTGDGPVIYAHDLALAAPYYDWKTVSLTGYAASTDAVSDVLTNGDTTGHNNYVTVATGALGWAAGNWYKGSTGAYFMSVAGKQPGIVAQLTGGITACDATGGAGASHWKIPLPAQASTFDATTKFILAACVLKPASGNVLTVGGFAHLSVSNLMLYRGSYVADYTRVTLSRVPAYAPSPVFDVASHATLETAGPIYVTNANTASTAGLQVNRCAGASIGHGSYFANNAYHVLAGSSYDNPWSGRLEINDVTFDTASGAAVKSLGIGTVAMSNYVFQGSGNYRLCYAYGGRIHYQIATGTAPSPIDGTTQVAGGVIYGY